MNVRFLRPGRRSLRILAPGAALLLLLSAGAFAAVEARSVHSFWDGLWWSLSLVSTVGFAGALPHTGVGKIVSASLMVLGFALLATTTAAVASLFVREDELPEDERELAFERDVVNALRELEVRLAAIEGALRASRAAAADPTIGRPDGGSTPTPGSSRRSMSAPIPGGQPESGLPTRRNKERHMNETFRLGRIAGIPVGLNWSWLIVFALFVWSLASVVFPSTNPGLGTTTYVEMGVAAVLLFFGSLLLHELGHALQARRDGVEIDGITLWLFGGVARFRGIFPSAGAELRIAIAGPLVTAVLAAVFLAVAALTHFQPALDAVFAWLGYVNLLLLGFNLLPAFPLDGGRVLRAALWRVKGDFAWATRVAAGLGRGIGGLMIVGGLITLFAYSAFSGLWLAMIGWFVLGAAGGELRLVSLRDALDGLVVADIARLHPIAAQADQTLRDFMAEVPWEDDSSAYPVLDGLRPAGILPSGRLAATPPDRWAGVRVRDRMVPLDELPVLGPDDPALDAMLTLSGAGVDTALVLDEGGRLVGVVSARDVADALGSGRRPSRPRPRRSGPTTVVPLPRRAVSVPGARTASPRDAA